LECFSSNNNSPEAVEEEEQEIAICSSNWEEDLPEGWGA